MLPKGSTRQHDDGLCIFRHAMRLFVDMVDLFVRILIILLKNVCIHDALLLRYHSPFIIHLAFVDAKQKQEEQ